MRSLSTFTIARLCAGITVMAGFTLVWAAGGEYMPICNLPKCLNPQVTSKSGIGTANAIIEAKIHPDDAGKWCATYKPRDKYCAKE